MTMPGCLPDKENNRLGNRPPRAPGSLKMLVEPPSTASSRGHTALSVARTESAASDPWTDRMEVGDGMCEVVEELNHELNNEPSCSEFEFIKLCPQTPDGYIEEDQVLLPMIGKHLDVSPSPAPPPRSSSSRASSLEVEIPDEISRGPSGLELDEAIVSKVEPAHEFDFRQRDSLGEDDGGYRITQSRFGRSLAAASPPESPEKTLDNVERSKEVTPSCQRLPRLKSPEKTLKNVERSKEAYLEKCMDMRTAPITKLLQSQGPAHEVDLTHRGLGNRGAVALATFIATNEVIRNLHLGDNNVSKEGGEAIFDAVDKHGKIEEIHLAGNAVGPALQRLTAAMSSGARSVKVIDLSKNKLGDEGCVEIGRALAETAWVEQLSLADNQVTDSGIAKFFDELCSNDASGLKVLDLRWNRLRSPKPFINALTHPAFVLQYIDLTWNKLGTNGAAAIAKCIQGGGGRSLRTLILGNCDISGDAALPIARALQSEGCQLQELVLSGNPIGHEGAMTVLGGVREASVLKRIEMRGCGILVKGEIPLEVVAPEPNSALDGKDNVHLLREMCPGVMGVLAMPVAPKPPLKKTPRPVHNAGGWVGLGNKAPKEKAPALPPFASFSVGGATTPRKSTASTGSEHGSNGNPAVTGNTAAAPDPSGNSAGIPDVLGAIPAPAGVGAVGSRPPRAPSATARAPPAPTRRASASAQPAHGLHRASSQPAAPSPRTSTAVPSSRPPSGLRPAGQAKLGTDRPASGRVPRVGGLSAIGVLGAIGGSGAVGAGGAGWASGAGSGNGSNSQNGSKGAGTTPRLGVARGGTGGKGLRAL